jgi:hypothetical protein
MTRIWANLAGCAALALAGGALAQGQHEHHDKGKDGGKGGGAMQGGGPGHAKHQHHHNNGHQLLGAKLKQDGKHAVGKFKDRDVTAEVKGGKVVSMAAGDLQGKRVRTKTKMVSDAGLFVRAAWNGQLTPVQYDAYQYGYCFDDGVNFDCYWYPPEDVAYQDYTWEDYDPTY